MSRTENLSSQQVFIDPEAMMWSIADMDDEDISDFILDLVDYGYDDWQPVRDLVTQIANYISENESQL